MKTENDKPKTDYYWKCYAEAQTARRMAATTYDTPAARRYTQAAKAWNAKAKRAARMMGRA